MQRYADMLRQTNQRSVLITGDPSSFRFNADFGSQTMSRLWGMPNISGYGPLLLTRYAKFAKISNLGTLDVQSFSPSNRALDLLAGKYIFVHNARLTPQSGVPQNGIRWSEEDLDLSLGSGCGSRQPAGAGFTLPQPFHATSIGIVSSMVCATDVSDGAGVVRILVTDLTGSRQILTLRAGRDTSEWAFDRSDVRPIVNHARATLFKSYQISDGNKSYKGHRYVGVLALDKPMRVGEIQLQWIGSSGAIGIQKISLLNNETGKGYPVTALKSYLANTRIWRRVEDLRDAGVYENLRAMPRAWLVPQVVNATADEILRAIQSSQMPDGSMFDPYRVAFVEEPFSFMSERPGPGQPRRWSIFRIRALMFRQAPIHLHSSW